MKLALITIFCFSSLVFCQNSKPLRIEINNYEVVFSSKNFEKQLSTEKINKDILLDYNIINESESDYAIIVDKERFMLYENNDMNKYFFPNGILEKQIFQPAIVIKNPDCRIPNTGYVLEGDYLNDLPELETIINRDIIKINAKSKVRIKGFISLPINNNNLNNQTFSRQLFLGISQEGHTHGTLSLIIVQNKYLIEKYLSKRNLQRLKKSKILIFNGLINSNEIPLIIK